MSRAPHSVFARLISTMSARSSAETCGRVLVLDAAKGGVATAWILYEMKARGVMPAALVLNAVNPIMVQGAALADFTMISGFDVDITRAIPNGALVEVNPDGERPFIRLLILAVDNAGLQCLRVLSVQAAWAVLIKPKSWERYGLKPWLKAAKKRLHHNMLAIAFANKLARIARSVLARGRSFEVSKIEVSAQPASM